MHRFWPKGVRGSLSNDTGVNTSCSRDVSFPGSFGTPAQWPWWWDLFHKQGEEWPADLRIDFAKQAESVDISRCLCILHLSICMCIYSYSYVWTVESKSVQFPNCQLATSLFAGVSNCWNGERYPGCAPDQFCLRSLSLAFWSTGWTIGPLPLCCPHDCFAVRWWSSPSQSAAWQEATDESQQVNTYIDEAWPRPSKAVKSWNFLSGPGYDVDYLFGQVEIKDRRLKIWGSNLLQLVAA